MGECLSFKCRECGHVTGANVGIGFFFPKEYQDTVKRIRNGEYGPEWKELYESTPGAAVNAEADFYVCPSCGAAGSELNLSIYQPKVPERSQAHEKQFCGACPAVGMEYVMPGELKEDYIPVKEYVHACPACAKPMRLYAEGDKVKCPECRDGWMEADPEGMVLWD